MGLTERTWISLLSGAACLVAFVLFFVLVYWHQRRKWERESRREQREIDQRAHHEMHREIMHELPGHRVATGMPAEEATYRAEQEWREYAKSRGIDAGLRERKVQDG